MSKGIQMAHNQYAEVLRAFMEVAGEKKVYTGTIDGNGWMFAIRALIYRDGHSAEDVTDIVPIWWEFSTFNEDGVKVENDFSMKYFRSLIE